MGKGAADLLTLSGYVRGRLSGAARIATQLVTHLRLAAEVITCLQSSYLPALISLTWVNVRP